MPPRQNRQLLPLDHGLGDFAELSVNQQNEMVNTIDEEWKEKPSTDPFIAENEEEPFPFPTFTEDVDLDEITPSLTPLQSVLDPTLDDSAFGHANACETSTSNPDLL